MKTLFWKFGFRLISVTRITLMEINVFLGESEDPLEKEMAIHSITLA